MPSSSTIVSSVGSVRPRLSSLPDWLMWRSAATPERLAVKWGNQQLTYAELQEEVSIVSGLMLAWGVNRGNRVCLLLNPSIFYVSLVHALTRIGAVIVPLNPRQSSSEILLQISDCTPKLVLYEESFTPLVKEIQRKASSLNKEKLVLTVFKNSEEFLDGNHHNDEKVRGGQIKAYSPHSIIYTSGSTGAPKGVVLTAWNLWSNAISFGNCYRTLTSDRWLLAMPLYHVGGYMIIFRSVILGSGIVIQHGKFDANTVSRSIDRDRVTLISLVPTMLESLLKVRKQKFPKKFRFIFLGGSTAPPSLVQKVAMRKLPVVLVYGMTESCSMIAATRLTSLSSKNNQPKTISYHAMVPTQIKIRRRESKKRSGQVGRILIRGPTIFLGYWKNNDVEPRRSAWFDTGDVGYEKPDGRIIVLGRENDMIITGGENVYPIEVESPLLTHKAIEDAVVIGRDDPRWGQRIEVVLKIKPNYDRPTRSELDTFLRKRIGSYKIPKAYHYLSTFAKTQDGKVKRAAIAEIIEKRVGRLEGMTN